MGGSGSSSGKGGGNGAVGGFVSSMSKTADEVNSRVMLEHKLTILAKYDVEASSPYDYVKAFNKEFASIKGDSGMKITKFNGVGAIVRETFNGKLIPVEGIEVLVVEHGKGYTIRQ